MHDGITEPGESMPVIDPEAELSRPTIYSAAPFRKTAEAEVRAQGYSVIGSEPEGGGRFLAGNDPKDDINTEGWHVEVMV